MAQIINITSEALQATIRRLLPSQRGFGEDLQASNVITPVIDVTPTAEGSQLPVDLARAFSSGSASYTSVTSNTTFVNTPGFYHVHYSIYGSATSGIGLNSQLVLNDGLSNKLLAGLITDSGAGTYVRTGTITVFLKAGESIGAVFGNTRAAVGVSITQVADVYGNIVNPSGFTFE